MAQVNNPNVRQPDDALTTIIKGLTIANGVFGIATNMNSLEKYQKEKKDAENLENGIFTKDQQLELRPKFDIFYNEPAAPFDRPYQKAYDSESGSAIYVALKKDESPLLKDIKTVRDKKAGTLILNQREILNGRPDKAELGFYESPPERTGITPYQKETLDFRRQDALDKGVERAGKSAAPFENVMSGYERLETSTGIPGFKLENYNSKDGTYFDPETQTTKKVDLPGSYIGGVGFFAQTSAGREAKAAIAQVMNTKIYDVSGKAITNAEMNRIREEFAQGKFKIEEEVYGALKQYKAAAVQALKSSEAKFSPNVLKEYKNRGGFSSDRVSKPELSAPPIGAVQDGYIYQGGDPSNQKNWKKK